MRASEQVRMNLGYMKHNVNLVALGSGVGMGFLGNSHFGLEDLSIIRAIPNLKISAPADTAELGKILYDYTFNTVGPSYINLQERLDANMYIKRIIVTNLEKMKKLLKVVMF